MRTRFASFRFGEGRALTLFVRSCMGRVRGHAKNTKCKHKVQCVVGPRTTFTNQPYASTPGFVDGATVTAADAAAAAAEAGVGDSAGEGAPLSPPSCALASGSVLIGGGGRLGGPPDGRGAATGAAAAAAGSAAGAGAGAGAPAGAAAMLPGRGGRAAILRPLQNAPQILETSSILDGSDKDQKPRATPELFYTLTADYYSVTSDTKRFFS
jgi:hypothetical protein